MTDDVPPPKHAVLSRGEPWVGATSATAPADDRAPRAVGESGQAAEGDQIRAVHAASRGTYEEPDQQWVTDITEHPTCEGTVYCAVVLNVYSRRVVGWSIDAAPTGALVTNAPGMAIDTRQPTGSTVIHRASRARSKGQRRRAP